MFKSLVFASLLAAGSAHQNFHQFWVNDVSPGYEVGIRMPPSNNPVTDVTSNDIACNVPATWIPAGGVATVAVNAGDKITVQWDQSTHPGPITHMLFGPISSASTATGVGQWAKIDELNYVDGKWANEIMSVADMKRSFNLPANLASGEYLLRSEMLALHGSQQVGGAQFYIGCAQIKVTGPGGACSPKISLPGAYSASDSNIYIPNFYNGFQASTFKAPGGSVATCGAGGSNPTTARTSTTTAVRTSTAVSQTTSIRTSSTTTAIRTSTAISQTTLRTTTRTTTAASSTSTPNSGVVAAWGQCGGSNWTGGTVCAAGSTCVRSNEFYSQCIPS